MNEMLQLFISTHDSAGSDSTQEATDQSVGATQSMVDDLGGSEGLNLVFHPREQPARRAVAEHAPAARSSVSCVDLKI